MARRCIHGEEFPCPQCTANRRWNESATGRKLTEAEFAARFAEAGGAACCPACGSDALVTITPARPGPAGWGYRCKACGHAWDLAV